MRRLLALALEDGVLLEVEEEVLIVDLAHCRNVYKGRAAKAT